MDAPVRKSCLPLCSGALLLSVDHNCLHWLPLWRGTDARRLLSAHRRVGPSSCRCVRSMGDSCHLSPTRRQSRWDDSEGGLRLACRLLCRSGRIALALLSKLLAPNKANAVWKSRSSGAARCSATQCQRFQVMLINGQQVLFLRFALAAGLAN